MNVTSSRRSWQRDSLPSDVPDEEVPLPSGNAQRRTSGRLSSASQRVHSVTRGRLDAPREGDDTDSDVGREGTHEAETARPEVPVSGNVMISN